MKLEMSGERVTAAAKAQAMVIGEVMDERTRQEVKWGEQNHDPFTYLAILGEEVGEANRAALEARSWRGIDGEHTEGTQWDLDLMRRTYRKELIQVAAVAVAMVEAFDRRKFK